MTKYRVKTRVYCMGQQYHPDDVVDEKVAAVLGDEVEPVLDDAPAVPEGDALPPIRKTKPIKKASLK